MPINPIVFDKVYKFNLLNDLCRLLDQLEEYEFYAPPSFRGDISSSIEYTLNKIDKLSRE